MFPSTSFSICRVFANSLSLHPNQQKSIYIPQSIIFFIQGQTRNRYAAKLTKRRTTSCRPGKKPRRRLLHSTYLANLSILRSEHCSALNSFRNTKALQKTHTPQSEAVGCSTLFLIALSAIHDHWACRVGPKGLTCSDSTFPLHYILLF